MKRAEFLIISVCLLMFSFASFTETVQVDASVEGNFRLVGTESLTVVVPDDFFTIQEAINNAFEGGTIFVKSGIYYEHVVVNKTVSLVGEDVSTTIIDGNNTGHVLHILSDYVNVTGFTIQNSGNIHTPNMDAGVCLNGTMGCTISENRAINNGFSAISLIYSSWNTITSNNLSGAGWGGIHLMGSIRNVVSGNVISDKYGGINGHVSSNYNNITENNIMNSTHGMFYHASHHNRIWGNNMSNIAIEGIWLQDKVNYNVVTENRLVNATVAIRLQGPNYSNIVSGNFLANGQCAIRVQNAGYTEICNNTIVHNYGDEWDAGIRLDSASYTRIHSNLIVDNGRGIVLYTSSPYVSIYENNVTNNDYGIRVAMGGSSYVNISDNYVANNRGYGIDITGFGGGGGSDYATIARNLIVNNTFEAVGLGIDSSHNTVVENTMIGNGHAGVTLERYSNYNTIIQNNIIENAYGICFDLYTVNSTHNTIFNNNMINNTQQVRIVPGSVNAWNGSYTSGGNYWSDYVGVDVKSCPNQDVPGSDGIGDTPYVVDVYNRDNYPLMKPYTLPVGIRDVAVVNVTPSVDVIWMGSSADINVTVRNKGDYVDSRSVTVYYDCDLIGTQIVTLASNENVTLTFTWDTTGAAPGTHVIKAVASMVLAEANTANNVLIDGAVRIRILGDLSGDDKVDTKDIALAALAFGSYAYPLISPRWNPDADVNGDGRIDIIDLALIAKHFGEAYL